MHCQDGTWLVVGVDALIMARPKNPDVQSHNDIDPHIDADFHIDTDPWYSLQFVRFDARTAQVSIKWMDPGRALLELTADEEDPGSFMTALDERLTHALVVQKQEIASNGTRVTASIRRGPDGLFSAVVADGPLDQAGYQLANRLEAEVREGVGLE